MSGLLVVLLLMFLLTQPADDYILSSKHQIAEHITQVYITRMRLEGRLSINDENELKSKINDIGCIIDSDTNTYVNANAKESRGDPRILRSNESVGSELTLEVKCRPEPQPFKPRSLIGGAAGGPCYIRVGGREPSERIVP